MNNPSRPYLGIFFMLLAVSLMPGIDICAKLLGDQVSTAQITWARFFFHLVFLSPFFFIKRKEAFARPNDRNSQILRGVFMVLTTVFFILAIIDNPIPNALALVFIAPIIVTILSPFMLDEPLGIRRKIAAIIGFIGILIIINPRTDAFKPSLIFALFAGISFGLYMIFTRKTGEKDPASLTMLWTGAIGTLAALPFVFAHWVSPSAQEWLLLMGVGFFGATGHYCIILAFRYGEASFIAPFQYFEMITATIYSYLIFQFFPSTQTWIGIAIIICSGIYISWRETLVPTKNT